MDRVQLTKDYFARGYTYAEILHALQQMHNITISERTLHRILRASGLHRKGHNSDTTSILKFVKKELETSGSTIGYRTMQQRCLKAGLKVSQKVTAVVIKALDPEGVEERKKHHLKRRKYYSKGPNWSWHIDGYDKLKPFGFCIHGAIDGFSRRILWLQLSHSNKEPGYVCSLYLNCIKEINSAPRKVVADLGTENVYVAAAQRFLRRNHQDSVSGFNSFKYGKSTSNQRIEALWSFLRRACTSWWINFFEDMVESNEYDNTNNLHVQCLLFCFYKPLHQDLARFRVNWNDHRIRKQQNTNEGRPSGRPNVIYFMPSFAGASIRDCKFSLDPQDLQVVCQQYRYEIQSSHICCNDFVCNSFKIYLSLHL